MTGPHRTLTQAPSDAPCRVLRLPTMRDQFADTVNRANASTCTPAASSPNC